MLLKYWQGRLRVMFNLEGQRGSLVADEPSCCPKQFSPRLITSPAQQKFSYTQPSPRQYRVICCFYATLPGLSSLPFIHIHTLEESWSYTFLYPVMLPRITLCRALSEWCCVPSWTSRTSSDSRTYHVSTSLRRGRGSSVHVEMGLPDICLLLRHEL